MSTGQNAGSFTPGLLSDEPFVSGHGRARVVLALFMAFIALKAVSVVSALMQIKLLSAARVGGVTGAQAESNDDRQLVVGMLTALVVVPLAVAFLMWMHRVLKNIPALGNPKTRVEHSPGWGVGSFFIPIVNLFIPYRAVREAWVKSDPAVRTENDVAFFPASPTGLVLGWWLCWLAWTFMRNAAGGLESAGSNPSGMIAATWVEIVSDLTGALAAGLAIQVVRGLDRRQEERSRNVSYVPQ